MRLFYILCQLVQELKGVLEHPEHPLATPLPLNSVHVLASGATVRERLVKLLKKAEGENS